jgi:curved DNA-binding protein CbpA
MLASTTNLQKCYQLLGLDRHASHDEVKLAYRSLARKFHPDLNPDDAQAHQRFITLNQAYQVLLDQIAIQPPQSTPGRATTHAAPPRSTNPQPNVRNSAPDLTPQEAELKWQLYAELQSLLNRQQFLKAIALIEGLAQRFTLDQQICQWQGIIYSQFGHKLIERREFDKARIYLNKALKVDPNNHQLWAEVDRAFSRVAQLS